MSWIDWTALVLGTVQALATLFALYFAWRAVQEAHRTRQESDQERRLAYLERMAIAVAEMRRNYDQGNMLERSRYPGRLRALLQTTPRAQLRQTRAYAEREPGHPHPGPQYRDLGNQAQKGARERC